MTGGLKRSFVSRWLKNPHIFPSVCPGYRRVECVTLSTVLVEHLLAHYGIQMRVHVKLGFNAQHGGRNELEPVRHEGLGVFEELNVELVHFRQHRANLLLRVV